MIRRVTVAVAVVAFPAPAGIGLEAVVAGLSAGEAACGADRGAISARAHTTMEVSDHPETAMTRARKVLRRMRRTIPGVWMLGQSRWTQVQSTGAGDVTVPWADEV